jgi:hypothetical protein
MNMLWGAMRTRKRHGRGQALVEFALVFPVFMLVFISFIQLGLWAYDQQVLVHAVQSAGLRANGQIGPITSRMVGDPLLVTPYEPGITDSAFDPTKNPGMTVAASTCRKVANLYTASLTYQARLGWDWGCVYPIDDGTTLSISYPLYQAIAQTRAAFDALNFGPASALEVTACYEIVTANGGSQCVYSIYQAGPNAGYAKTMTATALTAAPAFISITAQVSEVKVGSNLSLLIHADSIVVLDRFLPSCRAPQTSANFAPGTCGWIL